MKEIEKEFYEIIESYTAEYLSFYDRSDSLISKKNNSSFHKEKERNLRSVLIQKSKEYPEISSEQKDYFISESLSKFNLLINPNSKS